MVKLTNASVRNFPIEKKEYALMDDALSGFGVRIKPSGVKSFMIRYRDKDGRSRKMVVGQFGKITTDEARKLAKEHFANIAKGGNPSQDKQENLKAATVNDLLDRFLSDHVQVHNKPKTVKEYIRQIDKHARPALGKYKVKAIKRDDISRLHLKMKNTPRQANMMLAILSKAFNMAELWGMRADHSNPCKLIPKYPENKRERFLDLEEMQRLGDHLQTALKQQTEKPAVVYAILLLAMTGFRLNEILNLKWDYIDFQKGIISLPDTKTIKKGSDAVEKRLVGADVLILLDTIPRLPDCPWVLPGADTTKAVTDNYLEKAWRRIRGQVNLEDVRPHDLRHSFASTGVNMGTGLPFIGKLLGHSQVQTTARYAHLANNPVKEQADRISGEIAQAMTGKRANIEQTAQVIPLQKKAD